MLLRGLSMQLIFGVNFLLHTRGLNQNIPQVEKQFLVKLEQAMNFLK